jgi:hypothetical protein
VHYDIHLKYYCNSQNELLTLGFSSTPTAPLKEPNRNVLSLSKRNIKEDLKQYDYIFSGNFNDFKISSEEVAVNDEVKLDDKDDHDNYINDNDG